MCGDEDEADLKCTTRCQDAGVSNMEDAEGGSASRSAREWAGGVAALEQHHSTGAAPSFKCCRGTRYQTTAADVVTEHGGHRLCQPTLNSGRVQARCASGHPKTEGADQTDSGKDRPMLFDGSCARVLYLLRTYFRTWSIVSVSGDETIQVCTHANTQANDKCQPGYAPCFLQTSLGKRDDSLPVEDSSTIILRTTTHPGARLATGELEYPMSLPADSEGLGAICQNLHCVLT